MKIGDKITCDNSKAVIVAQAKDGTFIGDNGGNLFKVTPDWKKVYNCPWSVGTKIANNHGDFATVISEEEYHAEHERRGYGYNGIFDSQTEPFVIFKYSSGAPGWDPAKYWHEVRDAGCPYDIGTKIAHINSPERHSYTVVSKKEWFEKNPTRDPNNYSNAKLWMTDTAGYYVYSCLPENYCELKVKKVEEDNSGKRYFEAYDSCARSWDSLSTEYKDKWNNLAKFIENERK